MHGADIGALGTAALTVGTAAVAARTQPDPADPAARTQPNPADPAARTQPGPADSAGLEPGGAEPGS